MSNVDECGLPRRIYLFGGLTGFSIATSLLFIADYLIDYFGMVNSFALIFEVFVTFLLGGLAAGYLVARRATRRYEWAGLKTGALALLINLVIMLLHSTLIGALWAAFGYILGGGLGGLVYRFHLGKQ